MAEQLLLGVIGDRVVRNPAWHKEVLDAACTAWEQRRAARPDETKQVNVALATVEKKITCLVDAIELGEADPDVSDRLVVRRRERDELVRHRDSLRRTDESEPTPPTAEWVAEQLNRLHKVLTGATPAAGVALRGLVGTVVVTETEQACKKQKHFRGTFTLRTAATMGASGVTVDSPDRESTGETVTLDFIDAPPWASVADAVKEMYAAGVRYEEMAERLSCPRSWPAKALAQWHRKRGLPPPDGRSTRDRLSADPAVTELSEKAKALWDEGLLMQEIAKRLSCCRDTVTAAIGHWHCARGLPTPDGRARRRELRLMSVPINSGQASA